MRKLSILFLTFLLVGCSAQPIYYGFSKRDKSDNEGIVSSSILAGMNYDSIAANATDEGIKVKGVEEIGVLVVQDGLFIGFKTNNPSSTAKIKKSLKKKVKPLVPNGYHIYIGDKEEVIETLQRLSYQIKGKKLSQKELEKRVKNTLEPLKQ